METFFYYLLLFISIKALVLFLKWSAYFILSISLLITIRLFISGEKLENSIRAALKLTINVYFEILKLLSALYVVFLIIVFIFYSSPSTITCNRCNGDGFVHRSDIIRLKENWRPGKCNQCKGKGSEKYSF